MDELLKKIPVSIIAICAAVLTVLISFAVIRGDSTIDLWGIKIDPKGVSHPASPPDVRVAPFPVGSVIASYLAPPRMQERYGAQWALADGREVSTKTAFYEITGKTQLPDLRGMFIRGLNVERKDDNRDLDGDNRKVGEYQADELKAHYHDNPAAGIWGRSFKGENGAPKTAHELKGGKTGTTGGKETRPRNVALYYYIRID
jgi:hypothetical protein